MSKFSFKMDTYLIKVLFFIMVMVSVIFPYASFAEEDEGLIVSPIEIMSIKNNKIFGTFTLTNDSDIYIPKVSYIINLVIMNNIDGEEILISINNVPANSLELRPREEKVISFEYEIPENLPKNEYLLYIRVTQKDVITDDWQKFTETGELGEGSQFISASERNFELLNDVENPFNITISPEIKKESEIKLSLKSSFSETIVATPRVQIFYPNIFNPVPALSYEGERVVFEPNKDTDFTLKIPALNNAGQYLVKVAFFNGDKQVSQALELLCFVNGKVANIVNATAYLTENNKVLVTTSLLGNRLSSKEKEYELIYKIYNKDTGKLIKEETKKIKLNDNVIDDEVALQDIGDSNVLVSISIVDDEELLAAHSIEINKEKLTDSTSYIFGDITSERHRKIVLALVDMGFLTGYPDGTFRPSNNITRAEFTVLATRLAKAEMISQASNFSDVSEDYWAKDFINTAYKKQYLKGYGNGLFMPNNNVTYQEAVTILVNILGYPKKDTSQSKIERFNNLSWPHNYIEAGMELELLKDILIEDFAKPATRQDVAVLIMNAYLNK